MPKCVCGADSRHFGATVNSRLWSMFKIIWKTGTLLGMLSSYHREYSEILWSCSVFSSEERNVCQSRSLLLLVFASLG